jgi:hypothetical protein
VVGVEGEGRWEGMIERFNMRGMFAAKMKSHLMLVVEAYEVIYVVM